MRIVPVNMYPIMRDMENAPFAVWLDKKEREIKAAWGGLKRKMREVG